MQASRLGTEGTSATERRSRMDIICTILKAIGDSDRGARKTYILYRSNLSHPMLNRYLDFILECGLVKAEKSVYYIGEKGLEFIRAYERMRGILES